MNERIEELAEQSGFTVARGWGLKDTVPKDVFIANVRVSDEMKKFAELIVNQCADIAQQHNKSPVAAPLAIGYVIREHFGVK
jgi:hypothetical protein